MEAVGDGPYICTHGCVLWQIQASEGSRLRAARGGQAPLTAVPLEDGRLPAPASTSWRRRVAFATGRSTWRQPPGLTSHRDDQGAGGDDAPANSARRKGRR